MQYFSNLIFTLLLIIIAIPATKTICEFFSIEPQVYGSYMLWFISLMLFIALLPQDNKSDLMKILPLVITVGVAAKTNVATGNNATNTNQPSQPLQTPPLQTQTPPLLLQPSQTPKTPQIKQPPLLQIKPPPPPPPPLQTPPPPPPSNELPSECNNKIINTDDELKEWLQNAVNWHFIKEKKLTNNNTMCYDDGTEIWNLSLFNFETPSNEPTGKFRLYIREFNEGKMSGSVREVDFEIFKDMTNNKITSKLTDDDPIKTFLNRIIRDIKLPSKQSGGKWNILLDFDRTIAKGHSDGNKYTYDDNDGTRKVYADIMDYDNITTFIDQLTKWFEAGHKVAIISRGITFVNYKIINNMKKYTQHPLNNLIDYLKLILNDTGIAIIGYKFISYDADNEEVKLIDNASIPVNNHTLYVVGSDSNTFNTHANVKNVNQDIDEWWASKKIVMFRKILPVLNNNGNSSDDYGIYKSVFADDTYENFKAMGDYDFFDEKAKMPCFWADAKKYKDTFKNVNNIIEGRPIEIPLERTNPKTKTPYTSKEITRNYTASSPPNK